MPNDEQFGTRPAVRFVAVGDWGPGQVRTSWVASSHVLPPDARDLVERAWREAAARPGVKLFDGPMCRLESWSVRGQPGRGPGDLELVLSPTSYKAFLGTNMRHPELADRFGPRVLANPVGVSPALETADGYLLMGRRNAAVAYYPGRIHPFAGSLEAADADGRDRRAGPDPFTAVRRELAEELSLTDADVADARCAGIVEDAALRQPEVIFRVRSTRTRSRVEAQVARDEHHACLAIPATEAGLAPYLHDPLLTPVAVATLLLWGRAAFGPEWFERQTSA